MFTPTETATNPSLKTVSYGIAPGAADEDIDVQSEEMLVNRGPQHPSTHGVLRIVLRTDGEMVLEAVPHLGYLHRFKEKSPRTSRITSSSATPIGSAKSPRWGNPFLGSL